MADANTLLLLHCDGTDGSTTITDSSDSARTVTCVNDAQLDTAQKKFGSASILFDGTGDGITIPDSADFNFGTGAFTVDLWIRYASLPGSVSDSTIFVHRTDANNFMSLIYNDVSNRFSFYVNDASVNVVEINANSTLSVDTWYHVAFVRNGTDWRIYLNGTSIGSATVTHTIEDYTSDFYFGDAPLSGDFNGWMDEIRISNVARWTSNFTPPSSAYDSTNAGALAMIGVFEI